MDLPYMCGEGANPGFTSGSVRSTTSCEHPNRRNDADPRFPCAKACRTRSNATTAVARGFHIVALSFLISLFLFLEGGNGSTSLSRVSIEVVQYMRIFGYVCVCVCVRTGKVITL
jgi:hypothetical protein